MSGINYISPWIFTTDKCNLACPYCYVKQKDFDMSELTLFYILNKFSKLLDTKQVDKVVLRIAGGEPMLAFNTWAGPIEYFLQSYPKQASAGLISNLTILKPWHINYLNFNKFGFGISLDGWSFSKEFKNGKSSAEYVRHNIDTLAKGTKGGYNKIDISTVITSKSINDIEILAEWVAIRNMNWGVYLDHYYDDEFNIEFLAKKLFQVIDILFDKGYDVLNKFKFNNVKLSSTYDGCTAGQNLIAIDTKGYVYDCQTAIYGTPNCHIKEYVPRTIPKHTTPERCNDCPIKEYCRGGCKLNNNFGDTCSLMLLVNSHILSKMEI